MTRQTLIHLLTAALLCISPTRLLADDHFIPFAIPAVANPDSLVAFPAGAPILPDSPHMVARGGSFFVADKRVKLWAVNFTFAADFPAHADAEAVALRLSQAGVNCVRFHHMDTLDWNSRSGIWDAHDLNKLSPEALDRLDYLIAQLAKHGIYADLNLHVGREHSKYLKLPPVPPVPGLGYDKMIDIFTPELIAAQKKYASDLLTHVNPYRGLPYTTDPVVALVEINNEDSLFMWGGPAKLRSLPEPYAGNLRALYNVWLKERYKTTAGVRDAWLKDAKPLGDEVLSDPQITHLDASAPHAWFMEIHPDNKCQLIHPSPEAKGVRIQISAADPTIWHMQFQQPLKVEAGVYYTLTFKARADKPRSIGVGLAQSHEPWDNLGLSVNLKLTSELKTYTYGFTTTQTDDKARLSFSVGGDPSSVEFVSISLRPGGRHGLSDNETLEANNIELFPAIQTQARDYDTMTFLAQTEKSYWDSMRNYVKKDLGSKSLVTGTIVFGPLGLWAQSDMDFIDSHAYWQHPRFPDRQWDMGNWMIEQKAMFENPEQATLFRLAADRLHGKPFTVTEYCHPAPNDYQAECVPELATFAAAQDWDGVFLFDYGAVPNADHITSFFSTGENPAKWAYMSTGATIFRQGVAPPRFGEISRNLFYFDVAPMDESASQPAPASDRSQAAFPNLVPLIRAYELHDLNNLAVANRVSPMTWKSFLTTRTFEVLEPTGGMASWDGIPTPLPPTTTIHWTHDASRSEYLASSPGSLTWIGRPGSSGATDPVTLRSPGFAAITMVSLDSDSFADSHKILITAMGRAQSTDMQFSPDRRTVSFHWGKAPVLIEPVDATVICPENLAAGRWTLTSLSPAGLPVGDPQPIELKPGASLKLPGLSAWVLLTRSH